MRWPIRSLPALAIMVATVILGGCGSIAPPPPPPADFEFIFGDTLYPYSTLAKPAKGMPYVDATFQTTVARLTDSAADWGGFGTICGYSTWNPVSSDGQYLLLMGMQSVTENTGYVLYRTNGTYVGTIDQLLWWNSQDPEPRWDMTGAHPDRLYYRKDLQLRYVDVTAGNDGPVHDFSGDFPSYAGDYYIYNGEEGVCSADSRYWVFLIKKSTSPYDARVIFTYDRQTDSVLASKSITGHEPNGVAMSPGGGYVWAAYDWTGSGGEYDGPHAYTRTLVNPVKICNGIPHAAMCTDKQGHEVVCFMDSDMVSFARLDTGEKFDLYPQEQLGWNGSNLLHAAMPSAKRGWCLISTYSEENDHWADNQLFLMELDETKTFGGATEPRIWRLSFTQNIVGADYYCQQPNAQVSPFGDKIWWGANWRNVTGAPEVYQLTLPDGWWETLG